MAQVTRASAQSDANTVEIETTAGANTAARVGGVIGDITDSAAWCGTGAVAYRLTYSTAGNENAWSTTAWSDGTFIGVAAAYGSLPTTGAFRLGQGEVVMVKDADGNDSPLMLAAGGPGSTKLYLGYTTGIYNIQYRCVTSHLFDIGSTTVATIGNGFIGVGAVASLPTAGDIRLKAGGSIYALNTTVNVRLLYQTGGSTRVGDSTNTSVLYLDTAGYISAGFKPLRGFYSELSAIDGTDDVAVPNDSSPYTIGSYTFPSSVAGNVLCIEFIAYFSAGTGSSSKHAYRGRVLVQYATPSVICNSLIEYIGATPPTGLTVAAAITSGNTLQINATSTTTSFYGAAVEFWDHWARLLTSS